MLTKEDVSERLRDAGYRVTQQRLAVYDFLHRNDTHPTVDDIHAGIKGDLPKVSVATVYKSLESLVDIGLVKPIHVGSTATRFDASTEVHAHFRCIACNEIADVTVDHTPVATEQMGHRKIIGSNVEFYGFCASCRRDRPGLDSN